MNTQNIGVQCFNGWKTSCIIQGRLNQNYFQNILWLPQIIGPFQILMTFDQFHSTSCVLWSPQRRILKTFGQFYSTLCILQAVFLSVTTKSSQHAVPHLLFFLFLLLVISVLECQEAGTLEVASVFRNQRCKNKNVIAYERPGIPS